MESDITPSEAAAGLEEARRSAARMAAELRLPPHFHATIGGAASVQIVTTALGIAVKEAWAATLLLGGLGLFAVVGLVQLVRFRRLNGVWVWGLAHHVVLGGGTAASLAYALGFAGAVLAAVTGSWWLLPVAGAAGGVGYAVAGRRWWDAYCAEPTRHGRGGGPTWQVLALAAGLTGLVLLVSQR